MEYKGYSIKEDKNSVTVENIEDFNLAHTFECGQCFRWLRQNDGSFTGVVGEKAVNMSFNDGTLTIKNSTLQDFIEIWFDYLDLGRDYGDIKKRICKDGIMEKAVNFGYGIRLLNQDIWEMLISFIISANNMIPRIMKTVEILSRMYGKEIRLEDERFYTFPGPYDLAGSNVEQLQLCKGGFRCRYIHQAACMVKDGKVDFGGLETLDTDSARDELMRFAGVGPKVADCVLLFGSARYQVFPTDVWVKRVMEELYLGDGAGFKAIQDFARDYFGELAGFAQQYLFFYARENRIGTKKT